MTNWTPHLCLNLKDADDLQDKFLPFNTALYAPPPQDSADKGAQAARDCVCSPQQENWVTVWEAAQRLVPGPGVTQRLQLLFHHLSIPTLINFSCDQL